MRQEHRHLGRVPRAAAEPSLLPALLVLGGVAGVALAALAGATGPDAVAVAGVTFGAGAVATEVGFVLALWYGGARLERANPPPDGWDDEPY